MPRLLTTIFTLALLLAGNVPRCAALNLIFSISTSTTGGQFNATELAILNEALPRVERMWETALTGYRPGISIASVPISIRATSFGLASANFSGTTSQGGFTLATSGFININVNEIENFQNWQGPGANGLNFIDELLAHEVGHVLGIGTLWNANNVYVNNTFRYTGQHGLAAYQAEFDPTAQWVPVEDAGNPGTPNSHWDQLMRSSPQEGTPPPADPFLLDPRVGVTDRYGRDRALELMTGAIDPDYREPFISRFTIQSMRDLGYAVTEFEDANGDGSIDFVDLDIVTANMGATGLQIDSFAFGDVNRDRVVDMVDYQLLRSAIPEPSALALAALAVLLLRLEQNGHSERSEESRTTLDPSLRSG